jgi:CIC family chloride channel protein
MAPEPGPDPDEPIVGRAAGGAGGDRMIGSGGGWSLVRLALVAAVAGVPVGLVGGAFRRSLLRADEARLSFLSWAHQWPWTGWVLPVALVAAGAALAVLVVRFVPLASGSGIQHVEAVWWGEAEPAGWVLIPAKFVGALVAIGSGLVLGREGPTVHMGSVIGSEAAQRLGLGDDDRRVLQTAMGGAGLGVAFNAPLGGSLFVFEEVAKSFRLRLTLATMIGSASAIACSRYVAGNRPDFAVGPITPPQGWLLVVYLVFGAVTGLLGVGYNRLVVGGLDLFAHFHRRPAELRAAVVGAVVGLVLWFEPLLAGGGDTLAQRVLGGGIATGSLAAYLVVRYLIGPWSYSTGAPGGLFAPLLAVGAVWGALAHRVVEPVIPALASQPGAVAMIGMVAFFAAVVRAPLTGIVLIIEMTATTTLLVPMLAAAVGAVLVATLLRGEPIYDSLRARMVAASGGDES